MSQRIVNFLQTVQIHKNQGKGLLRTTRELNALGREGDEPAPVVQTRELVSRGQLLERYLGFPQFQIRGFQFLGVAGKLVF
jgi:hypothetical protein